MDLEDAVAPGDKGAAREAARALLSRPPLAGRAPLIRINHPSTEEGAADLAALAAAARDVGGPLRVLVPKVAGTADLEAARVPLQGEVELVAMIETVRGLASCEEIARFDSLSGLLFGGFDLSLELGAAPEWEPLLYARARVVHAARLGGAWAVDMPFLDVGDPEGLREEADRVRRLGFDGKAAIHRDQVEVIADAFCHTPAEVARARRVDEAAAGSESGVFLLDGAMVDRPVIEAARRIVAWAEARGD